MGMRTTVVGFIPPDAKFKQMYDAWKACDKAGVPIPPAVRKFFNDEDPDKNGVKVDLTDKKFRSAVKAFGGEMEDGYEIDLTKLPDNIKIVRFTNEY